MTEAHQDVGIRVSDSQPFRAAEEQARSGFVTKALRTGLATLILLAAFAATARAQASCTFYAAPNGTGNGSSVSSPFKIQDFWPRATAGRTLCLLDGTYSGPPNMILPPQNLNGVSGAPITVRALNDGKVLLNGTYSQPPIQLYYNDWFVIEGVNACCSINSVVTIARANNNVIRRVVAWDSSDGNNEIFGIHAATFNLLEDIAAFGTARKVIQASAGGDHTTIRRAWARWDRSTVQGPKETYALAYNNYWLTCENCIGTWSGQGMPQTYTLKDGSGNSLGQTFSNYAVDQPQGIFTNDGEDGDKNAHVNLLGSLAYVLPTDKFPASMMVFFTRLDSIAIKDTAVYLPSGYSSRVPFELVNLSGATNLSATNISSQGGTSSHIESLWRTSNTFLGGTYSTGENVFNSTRGASLCYRYQDGSPTNQPLWPWPMNQRIQDALVQAGRAPVDVTATVQSLYGAIPTQCGGASSISSPPPPTPTPNPTPNPTPAPPPPSGSATTEAVFSRAQWQFTVPASGNYRIWGRVTGATGSSDSVYYTIDTGTEDIFDTTDGNTFNSSYLWKPFSGRLAPEGVRTFSLGSGTHTVNVRARELGTLLDRIFVTSDMNFNPNTGAGVSGSTVEAKFVSSQYQFNVPAGTYRIWGHVVAPDGTTDSMYYNLDGGSDEIFDMAQGVWSSNYQWSAFTWRHPDYGPRTFTFGSTLGHVINLKFREPQSRLDRIIVTSDMNYTP